MGFRTGAYANAITNHTPIIHKDDRQELKNYIEKALYAVFSKYQSRKK